MSSSARPAVASDPGAAREGAGFGSLSMCLTLAKSRRRAKAQHSRRIGAVWIRLRSAAERSPLPPHLRPPRLAPVALRDRSLAASVTGCQTSRIPRAARPAWPLETHVEWHVGTPGLPVLPLRVAGPG